MILSSKAILSLASKLVSNKWTWIVLLGGLCVFLFLMYREALSETKRLEGNAEAVRTQNEAKIRAERLRLREARMFYEKDLQEIRDSLEIKEKQVVKYQYIKTVKEVHDTVTIHDTLVKSVPYFAANYKDKCTDATFRWKEGDSVGIFDVNTTVDLLIVDYWERKKLLGVRIFPRWGKKEVFIDVINKCDGDSVITNRRIEID